MLGARIAVLEDDGSARRLVHEVAELYNHAVVAEASDRVGALALLDAIRDGQIQPAPNVILLDGNLKHGVNNGEDAQVIAARIHELGIPAMVIGYSGNPMSDYGVNVHADARKDAFIAMDAIDHFDESRLTA